MRVTYTATQPTPPRSQPDTIMYNLDQAGTIPTYQISVRVEGHCHQCNKWIALTTGKRRGTLNTAVGGSGSGWPQSAIASVLGRPGGEGVDLGALPLYPFSHDLVLLEPDETTNATGGASSSSSATSANVGPGNTGSSVNFPTLRAVARSVERQQGNRIVQDYIMPDGNGVLPQSVRSEVEKVLNQTGQTVLWWRHCHSCHVYLRRSKAMEE
jgi:hypothetical protein